MVHAPVIAVRTTVLAALTVLMSAPAIVHGQPDSIYGQGTSSGQMLRGTVTFRYPAGWRVEESRSFGDGTEAVTIGDTQSPDSIVLLAAPNTSADCSASAAQRALHVDFVAARTQSKPSEWRNLDWRLATNDQVVYHQNGGNTLHREYVSGKTRLSWDLVTYCVGKTFVFAEIATGNPRVTAAFLDSIRLPQPASPEGATKADLRQEPAQGGTPVGQWSTAGQLCTFRADYTFQCDVTPYGQAIPLLTLTGRWTADGQMNGTKSPTGESFAYPFRMTPAGLEMIQGKTKLDFRRTRY